MKKLLLAGLVAALFGVGSVASAQPSETEETVIVTEAATEMPLTTIDDVEIPYEVLMYAQMKYQGHAVTQAGIVTLNGEQAYRLRVDKDSDPSDYDSFHLYYDTKWNLLDEAEMAPPPISKPEPKPDMEEPEAQESAPVNSQNEGRGGGFVEDEDAEPPVPDPEEEVDQEVDESGEDEEAPVEPTE